MLLLSTAANINIYKAAQADVKINSSLYMAYAFFIAIILYLVILLVYMIRKVDRLDE